MRSNSINLSYYGTVPKPPIIVSPKADSDWNSSYIIPFSWKYNGLDGQQYYRIQVFKIPYNYLSVSSLWYADTNLDNSDVIYEEAQSLVNSGLLNDFDTFNISNQILSQSINWTYLSNTWSSSSGRWTKAAGLSLSPLEYDDFVCESGKRYKVTYSVYSTNGIGNIRFSLGGVDGYQNNSTGTYSQIIEATSSGKLQFNVSVPESAYTINAIKVQEECVYDTGIIESTNQSTILNLSSVIIGSDGVYIWRMQTKGYLSKVWSNWTNDGLVRYDSKQPIIRNACVESYDKTFPSISSISDMSSPNLHDYQISIPENEDSGLYISYDYNDNSIILRGRAWNDTSESVNKRYYGMITFHTNSNVSEKVTVDGVPTLVDRTAEDPFTPFYVHEVIKNAYVYSLNKSDDGNYEKRISSYALDVQDLILVNEYKGSEPGQFLPKGLPNFNYGNSIYSTDISTGNHPIVAESDTTYLSIFPFHTKKVSADRKFVFPKEGGNGVSFGTSDETLIEVRYPAPYQDVFVLFSLEFQKIYAYGQYAQTNAENEDWWDSGNPQPAVLVRGWNVEYHREEGTVPSEGDAEYYDVFNSSNGSSFDGIAYRLSQTCFENVKPLPRAKYVYFNVSPQAETDIFIKIIMEKNLIVCSGSNGLSNGLKIDSVEFHMYPQTDCVYVEDRYYGCNYLIEEVNIGRSRISPRDLSVFNTLNYGENKKKYYKNLKYFGFSPKPEAISETNVFAISSEYEYFVNSNVYNGSFRLQIPPKYEYIPYFYPNAISVANASGTIKSALPFIYAADSVDRWDIIKIKSTDDMSDNSGFVQDNLLYSSDFIKFNSTCLKFSQESPYYYNDILWNDDSYLTYPIGKLEGYGVWGNYTRTQHTLDFSTDGSKMFSGGYSKDGVVYNSQKNGLYSICDFSGSGYSDQTKLYLKDFSNMLFRRSVEYTSLAAIGVDEYFTNEIKPLNYSYNSNTYTFCGLNNIVVNSANLNGPSWIFKDVNNTSYEQSVISINTTYHGLYGANGVPIDNWLVEHGVNCAFNSQYLLYDSNDGLANETIIRMVKDIPLTNDTLILRKDSNILDIPEDINTITGDTFSMGNIFANISNHTSSKNNIRLFFDIDASICGIGHYRYFLQKIKTEQVECLDLKQGTGNGYIKLQTINNYSDDGQTTATPAYINVNNYRSSIDVCRRRLETKSFIKVTDTKDLVEDTYGTGYGTKRFYCDINVEETGYYILHVQVKNKVNIVSTTVYSVPFKFELETFTESNYSKIQSIDMYADDGRMFLETDTTRTTLTSHTFTNNILTDDRNQARSLVLKNVYSADNTDYSHFDDLYVGFSDNYGLHFNVFAPYSPYNSWDFSRPIVFTTKSFNYFIRSNEPDWYFDPNDIRHYTPDTEEEFLKNKATDLIPGNPGNKPVTLIGFEDSTEFGLKNPLADKIYEFREEIIGKKLVLAKDLSMKFPILHVFKGTIPYGTKRIVNESEITVSKDSSVKVWIVVEDQDAVCALILSRKFGHYVAPDVNSTSDYEDYYFNLKQWTGTRDNIVTKGINDFVRTEVFGYPSSSNITSTVLQSVNQYLGVDPITDNPGEIPNTMDFSVNQKTIDNISFDYKRESFYISHDSFIEKESNIATQEGWTTQIFKLYSSGNTTNIWNNLNHSNVCGVEIVDKLVFGQSVILESEISSVDTTNNFIVVKTNCFDNSFGSGLYGVSGVHDGFAYEIKDNGVLVKTGSILSVSDDGVCLIVDGGSWTNVNPASTNMKLYVTVEPEQTGDSWLPTVDGVPIVGGYNPMGTTTADILEFAIVSSGAFYIETEGYYGFKTECNSGSYSDFCIDYMKSNSDVYGVGLRTGKYVGGLIKNTNTNSRSFYLTKGWHIGRFRYFTYGAATSKYAVVYYQKTVNGVLSALIPFVASRNTNKAFWSKSFRTVHGKLIDGQGQEYPNQTSNFYENYYFRAIVGTNGFNVSESDTAINKVAKIDMTNVIGQRVDQTGSVDGRTYAGQLYEEAVAIYESAVFDGTSNIKFWKSIKWTEPVQTPVLDKSVCDVEFYLRTGITEGELLARKWNDVGTSGNEIIVSPFTNSSGNNILAFSKFYNSDSQQEQTSVNRFIQFRMVLKTRSYLNLPRVSDVTIEYSKEHTVNFFTTTFDINSNIVRGILAYNGNIGLSEADSSLTDIQFGICTEEVSDGVVSTNFDDYTIIPTNESFGLADIGVPENTKFRVGIKFVSSATLVPSVDEFAMMFETLGTNNGVEVKNDTVADLKLKVKNDRI